MYSHWFFNTILGAHEKRGGNLPQAISCDEFRAWTDSCSLSHIDTKGAPFTWENGRGSSFHMELRLDRAICNIDWIDFWDSLACCTLPRSQSDHHPLLLVVSKGFIQYPSSFKFQNMWIDHVDCRRLISEVWNRNIRYCPLGPMQLLTKKLMILNSELKIWNRNIFGDIHLKVSEALQKVEEVQNLISSSGFSSELHEKEIKAQLDLQQALSFEESYWKDKSRLKWLTQGDRNTRFFHRTAQMKKVSKQMSSLRHGDSILLEPAEIENRVISYFTELFASSNSCTDNGLIEKVVPQLVSADDNIMLTCEPSAEEIKVAVFSLNKDSAPGPDGYGGGFFQAFWDNVGMDVVKSVKQFFARKIMPNLNSNLVVLIPKFKGADMIENFRPIALANFQFKIITKVLADRLSIIVPKIITEEQRGFIKDRQISECLCIASEAINMLDHKQFGGNIALKFDVRKAFDTIDWQFLLKVLSAFGFNAIFCNWIATILESAKLSFLVNGHAIGFFACRRGVRQGDPLSPLLFCIAEDVLSRSISLLVSAGILNPMASSKSFITPTHVLYADDILIFCSGLKKGLRALMAPF